MSDAPTGNPQPGLTAATSSTNQFDVAMAELDFHRQRIAAGSDLVSMIGQFIFVIAGVVIVGASRYPVLIVVLPLFWTAWLFHSAQREADTYKHVLLARRLEGYLNRAADSPVAIWTSALTSGAPRAPRPMITGFSTVYWALLYVSAWTTSIVVTFRHHQAPLAILQITTFVLFITAYAASRRNLIAFKHRCDAELQRYVDTWKSADEDA